MTLEKEAIASVMSLVLCWSTIASAFAQEVAAPSIERPAPGKSEPSPTDPCSVRLDDSAFDKVPDEKTKIQDSEHADSVKSDDDEDKIVHEAFSFDDLNKIDPRFAAVQKQKFVKGVAVRLLVNDGKQKWDLGPAVALARLNDAGFFTSIRHQDCFGKNFAAPKGKFERCAEVSITCPSGKDLTLDQAKELLYRFRDIQKVESEREYIKIQNSLIANSEFGGLKAGAVLAGERSGDEQDRALANYKEAQPEVSDLRQKAYQANMNSSMDRFDLWTTFWDKFDILMWNYGLRPVGNWWRQHSSQEFRIFIKNEFVDYTQSIINARAAHNLIEAITEGLYATFHSLFSLKPDTSNFKGFWKDLKSTCAEVARLFVNMPAIAVPTELIMQAYNKDFHPTGDFAKDWVGPKLGLNLERRPAGLAEDFQLAAVALGAKSLGPVTAVPLGPDMPLIPAIGYFLEAGLASMFAPVPVMNASMVLPVPPLFSTVESVVDPANSAPEIDAKKKTNNDIPQMRRDMVNQFAEENLR